MLGYAMDGNAYSTQNTMTHHRMARETWYQAGMRFIRQCNAVARKDFFGEWKTKFAINAMLMFVLSTVTMIAISTKEERVTPGVAAALLWVILFFSAMTGLAKSFVSEEERGTALLLRLSTHSSAVYIGKLWFNIVLTTLLNIISVMVFFFLIGGVHIGSVVLFAVVLLCGSIGTASATTLIAAIIAKANAKGALFAVLSFPVVLPLTMSGVEAMYQALIGVAFFAAMSNVIIMVSYCMVMITASILLFDVVWLD
jgi:heme exporter protein B